MGLLKRNAVDRMAFDDFFRHHFMHKLQPALEAPPFIGNDTFTPPKTPSPIQHMQPVRTEIKGSNIFRAMFMICSEWLALKKFSDSNCYCILVAATEQSSITMGGSIHSSSSSPENTNSDDFVLVPSNLPSDLNNFNAEDQMYVYDSDSL